LFSGKRKGIEEEGDMEKSKLFLMEFCINVYLAEKSATTKKKRKQEESDDDE